MKMANIATAKNQFSQLLQRVKRGETVLITERNKPVAQLVPVRETSDVIARLMAEGKLLAPKGSPLDVKVFLKSARPKVDSRRALSKAVITEREEGR